MLENFAEDCLELRVIIDILDNIDRDTLKQVDTLEDNIVCELLPTKRPEKFVGEEWWTLNKYNRYTRYL